MVERLTSEDKSYRRIHLTNFDYGLFLRFRMLEFELRCNAGEPAWVALSLDEARALFESMAAACKRQEMTKIQIGDLSWTTDARLNPNHPDRLVVRFSGQLGLGNIGLSRRRVLSACEEFSGIFGQISTISDEVGSDG